MRLGRYPAGAWGRRAAVLASASILVAGVAVGDAQAQRRRATLGVTLRVVENCVARASAETGAADQGPVCMASARPATVVEDAVAPAGVGGASPGPEEPAGSFAPATTTAGEAGGLRYLTVIY